MGSSAENRLGSMVRGENRTIRVLYIVPGSSGGSSMIFARKEIARIAAAGVEAETFMFAASASLRRAFSEAWALRRLVREYEPDIIHVHFGSLTAFTCAMVSRVPLVMTYRGSDLNPSPEDGAFRNAAQKLLSQLAALRASAIICVSSQLRGRLWWCHGKVMVIPSGADLELFRPIPRAEARKRLNWRNDEQIVLFNAGHSPEVKRLDLAKASVAVMRELIAEVRFVVLDGSIDHSEVPLYHSGADCLLLTSDYEGSPDIIKEALACDLPIVSVDVGDVRERLEGVYPSRIVERDPRSIGAAAAEIVVSGQRSNGRERVREISTAAVDNKILGIYRCVIGDANYSRAQQVSN